MFCSGFLSSGRSLNWGWWDLKHFSFNPFRNILKVVIHFLYKLKDCKHPPLLGMWGVGPWVDCVCLSVWSACYVSTQRSNSPPVDRGDTARCTRNPDCQISNCWTSAGSWDKRINLRSPCQSLVYSIKCHGSGEWKNRPRCWNPDTSRKSCSRI